MTACAHHDRCQREALTRARRLCKERGLRLTRQREQVLRLVWESHRPAKAYELLARMGASQAAKPKPPTVYRALDFLLECGLVHRLESLNAYIGCGHPNRHDDCYFLICQGCGTATECCSSSIASALDKVVQRHSFASRSATLEISGTCSDCRHAYGGGAKGRPA